MTFIDKFIANPVSRNRKKVRPDSVRGFFFF
jgi:hypothetical protein